MNILDLICPHSCMGCGRLGEIFCGCCKKYIKGQILKVKMDDEVGVEEVKKYGENTKDFRRLGGTDTWKNIETSRGVVLMNDELKGWGKLVVCGEKSGVLGRLIKGLKYESKRAAAKVLGDLMAEVLSNLRAGIEAGLEVEVGDLLLKNIQGGLAEDVKGDSMGERGFCWGVKNFYCRAVVIPLPTISRHIRQRGLDHTKMIAEELAKKKGFNCESLLKRRSEFVQVGATREQRLKQAQEAYMINGMVDKEKIYILLDDVWTTGASMRAAYSEMKKAGAVNVIMSVIAVSDKDLLRNGGDADGGENEINNGVGKNRNN